MPFGASSLCHLPSFPDTSSFMQGPAFYLPMLWIRVQLSSSLKLCGFPTYFVHLWADDLDFCFHCDECCSGLNENGPKRLICLNAWSTVGRTVWEGFGDVAVLEEILHWGQGWRFQKPMLTSISPLLLYLTLVDQDVSSQLFYVYCSPLWWS